MSSVMANMIQQGSVPPVHIYKDLLETCMRRRDLAEAKLLNADLAKHGLESNSFLSDLLVTTLVKCGGFEDGLQVFERLSQRTVFSWTAIISGYCNAGQCQEALSCYDQMLQERVKPNNYTFVSLLKACARLRDLDTGKRIHADAFRHGYVSDLFVGSALVTMYAKCGNTREAQQVFDGLPQRNVVLWNAMLSAYSQQDQGETALQIYRQMQEEGVVPNARTFVSCLQACRNLAEREESMLVDGRNLNVEALKLGREIHARAVSMGCDSDIFVGNTLVSMYAKCGSIEEAEDVFQKLSWRDVVSWTVMIAARVQQNECEKALDMFWQMQALGIMPEGRTFVSALQACGNLADQEECASVDGGNVKVDCLQKVKQIHAMATERGLQSDSFLGRTLISTYGKCGSMKDAEQVFGMLQKDVVSWTAMLAACAQQDQGERALEIYRQMQAAGFLPGARTFVSALQACGSSAVKEESTVVDGQNVKVESLQKGQEIHAAAYQMGLQSDIFVCNSLISMYAKCGSIGNAAQVFSSLHQRDVVSWNAMMAAYADQTQGEKALQIYQQMREAGMRPDARTIVCALQACGSLADKEESIDEKYVKEESLHLGKGLHADASEQGLALDVFVGSTIVSMYAKCGSIKDAEDMFERLPHRNVVSWTAMISAYTKQDQGDKALKLYQQMQEERVVPDARTFVSALQACSLIAEKEKTVYVDGQTVKADLLQKVRKIHSEAVSRDCGTDVFVTSTLVNTYAKCGSIKDAQQVFDSLSQHNVVSWTGMIAAFVEQGHGDKAVQLFAQMQAEGVSPDEATYVSMLKACSTTGALNNCLQMHQNITDTGVECTLWMATSLIHAYGKCGSMVDAQRVFDSLLSPNVMAWNALIASYSRLGNWEHSVQCYEKMRLAGLQPDGVTFLALVSACSHAGMVDKGLEYFETMTRDLAIPPQLEHFACVIDLVARAGLFGKTEDLLAQMPMQPNLPVWLCVLSGCRKHNNVSLGRRAFDAAVALEPNHAAAYGLMSSIYDDAGMPNSAEQIDSLRHHAVSWKEPGRSWIEHAQEVHTFVVGDARHAQAARLKELVRHLSARIRQRFSIET